MFIDISPLRKYPDYRLLYFGQVISFFGSMISYVAIPYQIYQLTKDNALVGFMGVVQLAPLLVFGILGGTYADRLNRRKLLLVSEVLMASAVLGLMLNSLREHPSVALIFVLVALMQAVLGFHRPSMEAVTQSLVNKADYSAVGALSALRFSLGAVLGPSIAGMIIASMGLKAAYAIDVLTFAAAFTSIYMMRRMPDPVRSTRSPFQEAGDGLRFAFSKPELVGTYLVDFVAMIFAFPVALFPAMSERWGGAQAAGILFSGIATGSLVATLFSGWTAKTLRTGRAVIVCASFWALFIVGVGFSSSLWWAFAFLALAGAADMLSGIFRGIIWNESVPNSMRGRLSGIEMISYSSGPLLGNARAGFVASQFSVQTSLISGGVICFVLVCFTASLLPHFWKYRSTHNSQ